MPCCAAAVTSASVPAQRSTPGAGSTTFHSMPMRRSSTPWRCMRANSAGRGVPAVSGPSAVTPRKPKGTARACAPPARTRDASPASNTPRSILRGQNPSLAAPER